METKAFGFEIKEVSDAGVIEGYASVFNNVDEGGDKIAPGAFGDGLSKAYREGRKVKMLWQHNPSEPIGIWDEVVEDGKGLRVKGTLVIEVARAREAHALMKAGAIGGLSVGYRTIQSRPDGNVRILEKLDLYEVSPVTFPMNRAAKITAVKGEGVDDLVEKLRAGDQLTQREFEHLAKGLGLSNSQAERAARVNLKGQGEPAVAAKSDAEDFYRAILGRSAQP